jgi:hypothetical protein
MVSPFSSSSLHATREESSMLSIFPNLSLEHASFVDEVRRSILTVATSLACSGKHHLPYDRFVEVVAENYSDALHASVASCVDVLLDPYTSWGLVESSHVSESGSTDIAPIARIIPDIPDVELWLKGDLVFPRLMEAA